MKKPEKKRFEKLYQRHQKTLKLQGKAEKTIDAYSRAIRRVTPIVSRDTIVDFIFLSGCPSCSPRGFATT